MRLQRLQQALAQEGVLVVVVVVVGLVGEEAGARERARINPKTLSSTLAWCAGK